MKRFIQSTAIVFLVTSCLETDVPNVSGQLQRDIEAIDNYLDQNDIIAIEDVSGLRYVIHELGNPEDGFSNLGNRVKIEYDGKLLGATNPFDAQNTNYASALDAYIPGWRIGIPYLPVGTEATLYIPSSLAYGAQGKQPSIPANANLEFDVIVEGIQWTTAQNEKLLADQTIIENFLTVNQLPATEHPKGFWYHIVNEGNIQIPGLFDKLGMTLSIRVINGTSSSTVNSGSFTTESGLRMVNFPNCVKYALPLIGKGGKIIIYSPSGLAYEKQSDAQIPQDANIIFEIELTDIGNP